MPLEKKRTGGSFSSVSLPLAWKKKFLHVDHALSCEDALAVVDRDRVCDDRLSYSMETGGGGGHEGGGVDSPLLFSH